jgi:hypothetical protein
VVAAGFDTAINHSWNNKGQSLNTASWLYLYEPLCSLFFEIYTSLPKKDANND